MRDFSKINDRFGGIDKNILKPVEILNKAGLLSIGSCEGHVKYGNPTPYVIFNFRKTNSYLLNNEIIVRKIISKFNRTQLYTYPTSKISITKTKLSENFIIISNKQLSGKYNKRIEANIKKRENGIKIIDKTTLSNEEIITRRKVLKEEQKAINDFAKYINNILLNSDIM